MIEQARMRVSAGESGIAGNSVDSLLGGSMFNAAESIAGIQRNTQNTKTQASYDAKGVHAQNKSQANAIKQPDWIGAGLQIAGGYYGNKDKIDAEVKGFRGK